MDPIQGSSRSSSDIAQRSTDSNVGTDTFLTLLVAQLKSQNPLEPMNPNEFVAQLAQFNSLSQLIEIRQLLEQASTPQTTQQTGAPQGAGGIGQ